jgi:hypothetical protein
MSSHRDRNIYKQTVRQILRQTDRETTDRQKGVIQVSKLHKANFAWSSYA